MHLQRCILAQCRGWKMIKQRCSYEAMCMTIHMPSFCFYLTNEFDFIRMILFLLWYKKQNHESLYPKWTITYHSRDVVGPLFPNKWYQSHAPNLAMWLSRNLLLSYQTGCELLVTKYWPCYMWCASIKPNDSVVLCSRGGFFSVRLKSHIG